MAQSSGQLADILRNSHNVLQRCTPALLGHGLNGLQENDPPEHAAWFTNVRYLVLRRFIFFEDIPKTSSIPSCMIHVPPQWKLFVGSKQEPSWLDALLERLIF